MDIQKANLLKGISPGNYIAHCLQKKGLSQKTLAKKTEIHPQSLNAIIKGKRKISLQTGLKIEKFFGWEEGSLLLLQLFYEIKKVKEKDSNKPDISIFRPSLFWDTDIKKINWQKNKKYVLKRILSRGNKQEQQAILDFYNRLSNQS